MIEYNDPTRTKNLHASRPLHYEDKDAGHWGRWLIDMAKDVAAVDALEHIEAAAEDYPPECESYWAPVAGELYIVSWWSPAAFGQIRMKLHRPL